MNTAELSAYLNKSVGRLIRSTIKDPLFFAKTAAAQKHQATLRERHETEGLHVPLFLIASITSACNLHCVGCYARANRICSDTPASGLLTEDDWDRIFSEAESIGVSFILLAGGEPLLRREILECAAHHTKIIFPVFTNGTILDEEIFRLFENNRSIVPIVSFEGKETDLRRGEGIFNRIQTFCQELKSRDILYGVSITTNAENYQTFLEDGFLDSLSAKVILFIEYTAVDRNSLSLELTANQRREFNSLLDSARKNHPEKWFISFPGDEEFMGGCLAGGRGFFHISPTGSAELCPFSPYSDRNLKTCTLAEAIESPLFYRLKAEGLIGGEHDGGCALVKHEDEVRVIALSPNNKTK